MKDKNWMLIVSDESIILRKWGAYDLSTVMYSKILETIDGG
ncbi:MAG: hypothetical protein QXT63_08995 [Thermoplasmata archaeon]